MNLTFQPILPRLQCTLTYKFAYTRRIPITCHTKSDCK